MKIKHKIIFLLAFLLGQNANAQALRGTTGLLHAPSAEMQQEGMFMFGGGVLDLVPLQYMDFNNEITHTFNYFVNITFFPWLEVGYTCTLNYAHHGSTYFPEHVWGKYTNQDRSFNARIRLWKEGSIAPWTPQIVLGLDDPMSHISYGGGSIEFDQDKMQNNYFTRYYLAATKKITCSNVGVVGVHLGFVYNMRKVYGKSYGPTAGVTFEFGLPTDTGFLSKMANGLTLIAEYDARSFNVGFNISCWKKRVHLLVECNSMKYWSGSLYYAIPLVDQ